MKHQTLLTKEILKKLPALRSQAEQGSEAIVYCKLFSPIGRSTWYLTEYDPETGDAFGYVKGSDLDWDELGYFNVNELAAVKLPFGLGIERDKFFANGKVTVGDILTHRVS